MEDELRAVGEPGERSTTQLLRTAKQFGFSDRQLATICGRDRDGRPRASGSGAASWPRSSRSTPAPPSSRPTRRTTTRPTRTRTKRRRSSRASKRIMILGGGPNRIGQGIEFDYCCCHASFALRELGIESIMVNSNPETVSTDYDTSDLLFFEPLTAEDVLNICDRVEPDGVIVQFGGQTPLNLARALANAGVPIIGTSVDTIEDAEDREKFAAAARAAGPQAAGQRHRPQHGPGAARWPARSAFRCWCGPASCSAAGRWRSATTTSQLERFVAEAFIVGPGPAGADRPLPGRRDRGRRRRHRDGEHGDRGRHHGAHRGGGRPLGRLGLRDPAVQPARAGRRRDPRGDRRAGPGS